MLKKLVLSFFVIFLSACGGSSDSGGSVETTQPGDAIPANFVGTYTGTLNLTASGGGVAVSESIPVTFTVTDDGMIRFTAEDPEDTATVGLANDGTFSATSSITEDECSGTITLVGTVDGTNVNGTVSGEGQCSSDGITLDVELSGNFNGSR